MVQQYQLTEADFRGDRFADWPSDVRGNNDLLSLTRPEVIRAIHDEYLDAGADCIFVPGVRDSATIRELAAGIAGPINILAAPGTPPIAELEKLGVARVSVGSGPMRASLALVRNVARELKARGTYTAFTANAFPYDELNELMR